MRMDCQVIFQVIAMRIVTLDLQPDQVMSCYSEELRDLILQGAQVIFSTTTVGGQTDKLLMLISGI